MGTDARTAFVLGGGGRLGAAEVGMLAALIGSGIRPDLVLGTSIGAINGVAIADSPHAGGVDRLRQLWVDVDRSGVFGGRLVDRVRHIATTRTSLHSNEPLRRLLERTLDGRQIEDLEVPYQCVAACIETAEATWFDRGPAVDAVLASCAVPGLLPAVRIGERHFLDGGVVDSIPVRRALELGATRIFVLQVGRIEQPLEVPRRPHEVALVAFEIARRHSFATAMVSRPEGVDVHVLPTGSDPVRFNDLRQMRYGDFSDVPGRIARAEVASRAYLDELES
ncbi:MAG: patatin-like phospholipase family protein [Microthrixaceae bacterium]